MARPLPGVFGDVMAALFPGYAKKYPNNQVAPLSGSSQSAPQSQQPASMQPFFNDITNIDARAAMERKKRSDQGFNFGDIFSNSIL